MEFASMSPQEQVAVLTRRIYERGVTTASGGNLSIRDTDGNIWVTPARMDKGRLQPADVVCVRPNGEIIGKYSPSTELPFHRAIYEQRPDIFAVTHAHCPSLVAFSIIRKIPQLRVIAQTYLTCGEVGYAPYAVTQSERLGQEIASAFGQGSNVVLMENHGVVTGGPDLLAAYQRLEAMELCAQTLLRSIRLGPPSILDDRQIQWLLQQTHKFSEFAPERPSDKELTLREDICRMVRRGYDQRLFSSTQGIISARLDDHSFLITPQGVDRQEMTAQQLALVRSGMHETGKLPDRSARLHAQIYADHPNLNSIISSQPPNVMAFSITGHNFNFKTIAESYITLKTIAYALFDWQMNAPEKVSALLAGNTPVLLLRNDRILTAGKTLLAAFDRLEVAEFSARSQIDALDMGQIVSLDDDQVRELDKIYFPEMTI